eukprot:scaffold350154_cov38-Prasinocladus_malaysianus.AAC.1
MITGHPAIASNRRKRAAQTQRCPRRASVPSRSSCTDVGCGLPRWWGSSSGGWRSSVCRQRR